MNQTATRILVVEDEQDLVTLLQYNLESAGFRVTAIMDGAKAIPAALADPPQLVVLDWMLPNRSGVEICADLRNNAALRHIPVIMLTAKGEEADKIRGFDAGADDYVVKPFSPKELIARIQAVLRRAVAKKPAHALIQIADISVDTTAHKVWRDGKEIHLGPTEFRLLRHFMENPGIVFSRDELLETVWGKGIYVELRTVDVHIRRLRKALNDGDALDFIRTVRSAGYAFEAPSA